MDNRGVLQFSSQVLLDALHLPEGTRIVGLHYNPFVDSADITIEHPDMPEVADGAIPPTCWPSFQQTDNGVEFLSWDITDDKEA
jgi:hypothetical protein